MKMRVPPEELMKATDVNFSEVKEHWKRRLK